MAEQININRTSSEEGYDEFLKILYAAPSKDVDNVYDNNNDDDNNNINRTPSDEGYDEFLNILSAASSKEVDNDNDDDDDDDDNNNINRTPSEEGHDEFLNILSSAVAPSREVDSTNDMGASQSRVNASKRERLRNAKVFVLDNSLRESTVGQAVGHSIGDKLKVFDATAGCGFTHQIVGCFSTDQRVDDKFAAWLQEREYSDRTFYSFSEVYEQLDDEGCFLRNHVPVGLKKMQIFGIAHPIIEVDCAADFTAKEFLDQLTFLLEWSSENLPAPRPPGQKRMAFVNIRDFPISMIECPEKVIQLVKGIAMMPHSIRPAGILQEEPLGEYFADEVAAWNQEVRDAMDVNGWPSLFQQDGETLDGLLLTHVHNQWGLADAAVLDVLAAGADGVWCSICEEGAAMGHASSCVTLANLARLGNKDVLTRYQTQNLATVAREVTLVTSNKKVHERQIVYGPRAIEAVFGFSGIAGGAADESFDKNGDGVIDEVDHFSLAKFLGVDEPPIRIHSLSSPDLVVRRLIQCFGDCPEFTEDIAKNMLARMTQELESNLEFEHSSPTGISMLWKGVTGSFHPKMMNYDEDMERLTHRIKMFLKKAEECFCQYLEEGEDAIEYRQFYDAYLQPYFGCFTCPRTRFVLDYIQMDNDGKLSWNEWRFWCLWALRTYPDEISNLDDLHNTIFRYAILPLSLLDTVQESRKSMIGYGAIRQSIIGYGTSRQSIIRYGTKRHKQSILGQKVQDQHKDELRSRFTVLLDPISDEDMELLRDIDIKDVSGE